MLFLASMGETGLSHDKFFEILSQAFRGWWDQMTFDVKFWPKFSKIIQLGMYVGLPLKRILHDKQLQSSDLFDLAIYISSIMYSCQ